MWAFHEKIHQRYVVHLQRLDALYRSQKKGPLTTSAPWWNPSIIAIIASSRCIDIPSHKCALRQRVIVVRVASDYGSKTRFIFVETLECWSRAGSRQRRPQNSSIGPWSAMSASDKKRILIVGGGSGFFFLYGGKLVIPIPTELDFWILLFSLLNSPRTYSFSS